MVVGSEEIRGCADLLEVLRLRAQSQPDEQGYVFLGDGETEDGRLTYGELERRARAVGAWLQSSGATGERVLLLYPPGLEYVSAFFGCLYAGAVAVPLYPPRMNRSLTRLRSVVADAGAKFVLTTSQITSRAGQFLEQSPDLGALRWLASDEAPAELGAEWRDVRRRADDSLAYLQYTSGSTAEPKGVMVSHQNLLHNLAYIDEGFRHAPESVFVTWLPHFHDMGLIYGLLQPLYQGRPVYLMPPNAFLQRPLVWLRAVSRYRATHSGGPNFAYDLCARKISDEEKDALDLGSWGVAFNGAEPIRGETLDRFAAAFARCGFRRRAFCPSYGLAEATLKVTSTDRDEEFTLLAVAADELERNRVVESRGDESESRELVGCGRTSSGTQVVVVHPETAERCEGGEVGEIWVAGPGVSAGYWNRPAETARTFGAYLADTGEGPFLRTGDLGFLRDGELFITGRQKELIIIRGRNHYPQDIELTAQQSHTMLRPGCGAAFSVERGGAELLVVVQEVQRHCPETEFEEAIRRIRRDVAEGHELHAHAVVLIKTGTLPKTSSGKIQRGTARADFLAGRLEVVGESVAEEAAGGARDEDAGRQEGLGREELFALDAEARGGRLRAYLLSLVGGVLGVAPSGLDARQPLNTLGLDSLMGIELTNRIETRLGVSLAQTAFLDDASIDELASALLEQLGASDDAQAPARPDAVREVDGHPHPVVGEHPLSYGQQSLWFLYQLERESAAYNVSYAMRARGGVDAARLNRACERLAARHAALRTTYEARGGVPVQIVRERLPADFAEVASEEWGERQLDERLRDESDRRFDLEAGPVLRVRLFRRAGGESVLLLAAHHITCDLWSLELLATELRALYESDGDVDKTLREPSAQYPSYVYWQRRTLEGAEGERLRSFWESELAGELPVLNLPTDRPRPPAQTFRGASHTFTLDEALGRSLKALARAEGATAYVTFLATFQLLLHHYAQQTELVVGSPAAGRSRPEFADTVGYFVNPVVLRSRLDARESFTAYLARVRRTVVGALAHQDYPFPLLVERLQTERDASRPPVFQVALAWDKPQRVGGSLARAATEAGGEGDSERLELETLFWRQGGAPFDLLVVVLEEQEGLSVNFNYNTDLFDASTVERMAGHLRRLLEGVVARPDAPVSELPLLTEPERRRLLYDLNRTSADYPRALGLHELFEAQAAGAPDAVALVCRGESLTYGELNRRANRLAHRLRAQGVGPEVRVGVCAERTARLVVSLLAVLKAGGAYVPLDPEYPRERLAFMLDDSRAAVLLTETRLVERLPAHAARVVLVDADDDSARHVGGGASDASPAAGVTADNLAYVIYTSGSTGRPKGVAIEHRSAVCLVSWALETFDREELRGVLASTSVCFDLSVFELFVPLAAGGTIVLADNALALPTLADRERVTLVNTVPSAMSELVRQGGVPASVRTVNLAGEPLQRRLVEQVYERSNVARVWNLYGPSEDTTYSTGTIVGRGREVAPTIGRPVWNTRVYILDASMMPVALGVAGEVYIGGEGLARGYLGRQRMTAERFVPDPFATEPGARMYRTGDLARYLPDGEIEFLGRIDHQVKVRGFRIELGEIEARLLTHEGVRETLVVVREDAAGDKRLVAYVVASSADAPPTPSALRRHLSEHLPDYMQPSAFVFLDAMPLTPNGKIDRKALPAPDESQTARESVYETPRTETEAALARLWGEVLGVELVGVRDNFFELGGHSLLATRVASRVRETCGVELPLRAIFESPTVAALAERVDAGRSRDGGRAPLEPIGRAPRGSKLPLSPAQRRLWFLAQLEPESPFYNLPASVLLEGKLDADALEEAFREAQRRHEILRTRFEAVDGSPVQIVDDATTLALARIDLRHLPVEEREAEARRLGAREARAPFDLARGPLWRVALLQLEEERFVLLLTLHHIIADGWSLEVLMREVAAAYAAFSSGAASPLPELPIQYADFAQWQSERLRDASAEQQLDYWRRRLAGAPPALELPTDKPRPPAQTYNGATRSIEMTPALAEALKRLSLGEGATLFTTLLAAFQTLLHRYTRQTDIVVGAPFAGRERAEVEPLVGFFVNTLPVRTSLADDPTFRELLSRVRESVLEAREHQDVPFEKLVEALPARDASRSPIFQVMFALQTRPLESVTLPGLRLTATPGETGTSKFDLTLFVTEGREGLSAAAEYNTDVFESETIGRLLGHFRNLLEAVVADPERRASELRLVSDDERRQLVAGWNATRTEYPRRACVHELFDEQAARTPGAPALLFGEESLTYSELRQKANQLARHLQGLGVATGANVAVYVERSAEMVVAFLGVLKAGAAYVPLDLDYPRERLSFMLEDARCEVLITREALRDRLPAGGLKVVSLDADADVIARHETSSPASGATAAHPAYVIYTSGSTGRPKGVCVPHRAINRLVWNTNYVALGPDDRVGQLSNASFDAATFELWGALTHGALLVGIDKEAALAPRRLAEEIAGRRVTAMFITSALFSQVAAEVAGCFGGVKHLIVGGDAVDPKWARRVLAEGAPARFVNGYGPTESTTFAVCGEVTEVAPDARSIPIGRPISNTEAYVLDARLEPVPVGVAGELYIGGEGLALGYLHRPALTADRFVPDPFRGEPGARLYRTGDLARRLPDGRIDFLGRLDHQVKLRGFRVELGEIESLLSRHAGVRETVVVVREEGGDKRLVAYVVASAPGAPPAHAELRRHLKEQLPDYMIPAAFVTLDALPLTPNGKVDRRALPAPDESRPELEADYEAPRTPTEELLASVWADLLGVGRVGVRDDFFELGGHSLLATRVVSRVREACGVELPLRALFESPNVAALAELVEREKSSGGVAASLPLRRVERGEQSPLSFAQQRLWFLDQLEEGGAAYHIAASVRLRGALDVSAFERAVGEVVRRHEVLRTTFVSVDGGPVQSVAAPAPARVPVVDLSEVARDERDAEARRLAAEDARAPFDLARGPLLRTTLLRLDADEHLLLLTMHHIVSDGWSMGVLVREIAALYESFVTGGAHALAELPIQYADFAVLQREWLRGDALGAQLDYWKRQLAGKLPPLELPADRPRPASQSFRGATLRWKLGRELAEGLKGLGRREGATLFVTLLAAFQTLLHRYTGQADIAVGTPFANRNRLELEPLIGFFVNTLVMRTDLSGDPTFRELLGRTRETTLSAQAHQELPFEMLVEALRPERSLGHSPLFQVMFAFEGGAATRLELHGLRSELEHVETGTAKFELTLAATESADGIEAAFEYNTDLFDESTIRRMVGHFETLLAGVAADPDRPLSALPLLTEAEHGQLRDWNDTDIEVPSGELIHTLFESRAARTPDALALVARDARLTCGELNARANQLARHLRETGVGPEVRVAVCAGRTAEMVVALLAVLKAGGAYVPLDPAYPRERVAFMLEDSRARVLLTEQRLAGHLPAREGLTTFCLDGEWPLAARHAENNLERAALPENLAYIIYTSGSTGVPKGVAIAHRSAVVLVEWAARAFAPDESEGVLASTSVCFDLSIYELFVPLARGGTIILADNALALPTLADAARVTLINTVPSAMTELVRAGAIPPSVRTVNLAGEPLPNELVQEIYSRSNVARVWNLYGPSEDTTYSTGAVIGRGANRQPSIGRPLANTQVHLLDANLRRVPVGVVGELYIGGDGLARGYWQRPSLTAERFVPDPFSREPGRRMYRTGDLARYRADGEIEFLGRIDHQVKIRGFRIELGEIESRLRGLPGVRECAVAAREDAPGDKRIVAYVVAAGGETLEAAALRQQLKEHLPDYMLPSAFVTLDALPLTPNGKIDRKALPAPDASRGPAPYVGPRTPVEAEVAGVWAEVLGVGQVGVFDDFFELGGHSLLAARMMSRIEQVFGVKPSLRQLFESPTVAELARLVEEKRGESAAGEVSKITRRRRGARDLSHLLAQVNQLSDHEAKRLLDEKASAQAGGDGQ